MEQLIVGHTTVMTAWMTNYRQATGLHQYN